MIKDIVSQDISVVLAVMDQDRHCGSVEMGRTTITLKVFVLGKVIFHKYILKEAKQTVEDPVKFSSHCPLVFDKKVKPLLMYIKTRLQLDNLCLPLFSGLWRNFVWLELSSNSSEIVVQFGQS